MFNGSIRSLVIWTFLYVVFIIAGIIAGQWKAMLVLGILLLVLGVIVVDAYRQARR